jgi:hypothetical protein
MMKTACKRAMQKVINGTWASELPRGEVLHPYRRKPSAPPFLDAGNLVDRLMFQPDRLALDRNGAAL